VTGLTRKHWTRLERLARDKHISFSVKEKGFKTLSTQPNVIKCFSFSLVKGQNKLERLSLAMFYCLV
jgi:hypothetical protein